MVIKMENTLKLPFATKIGKRELLNFAFIFSGTLIVAISINTFIIPHGLLSGGVSGLAILLHYLTGVPVSAAIFLMNIPIFWWGAREINRQFLLYSLLGTASLTLFIQITTGLFPVPEVDLVLAAIFGGALSGTGLGLVFRGHGSTGGTDIIAMVLRKKKNLGIGEVAFYANIIVIGLSLSLFPVNIGLYTIVSMFVASKVTDSVMVGLNTKKSVIIVSDHSIVIGERIINDLHRGVTYFSGTGAYTKANKAVVNCVVNRFEIARLKTLVEGIDPNAFMYISDASEVLGKGFSRQ